MSEKISKNEKTEGFQYWNGILMTPALSLILPVIAKLTYCAPAWSGLCSANDRARLDAFLRRSKRYGYCADDVPTITDLFTAADESLFERVLRNELQVLQPLLPNRTNTTYKLRSRHHKRQLIRKTVHINDSSFIVRMLYKDC